LDGRSDNFSLPSLTTASAVRALSQHVTFDLLSKEWLPGQPSAYATLESDLTSEYMRWRSGSGIVNLRDPASAAALALATAASSNNNAASSRPLPVASVTAIPTTRVTATEGVHRRGGRHGMRGALSSSTSESNLSSNNGSSGGSTVGSGAIGPLSTAAINENESSTVAATAGSNGRSGINNDPLNIVDPDASLTGRVYLPRGRHQTAAALAKRDEEERIAQQHAAMTASANAVATSLAQAMASSLEAKERKGHMRQGSRMIAPRRPVSGRVGHSGHSFGGASGSARHAARKLSTLMGSSLPLTPTTTNVATTASLMAANPGRRLLCWSWTADNQLLAGSDDGHIVIVTRIRPAPPKEQRQVHHHIREEPHYAQPTRGVAAAAHHTSKETAANKEATSTDGTIATSNMPSAPMSPIETSNNAIVAGGGSEEKERAVLEIIDIGVGAAITSIIVSRLHVIVSTDDGRVVWLHGPDLRTVYSNQMSSTPMVHMCWSPSFKNFIAVDRSGAVHLATPILGPRSRATSPKSPSSQQQSKSTASSPSTSTTTISGVPAASSSNVTTASADDALHIRVHSFILARLPVTVAVNYQQTNQAPHIIAAEPESEPSTSAVVTAASTLTTGPPSTPATGASSNSGGMSTLALPSTPLTTSASGSLSASNSTGSLHKSLNVSGSASKLVPPSSPGGSRTTPPGTAGGRVATSQQQQASVVPVAPPPMPIRSALITPYGFSEVNTFGVAVQLSADQPLRTFVALLPQTGHQRFASVTSDGTLFVGDVRGKELLGSYRFATSVTPATAATGGRDGSLIGHVCCMSSSYDGLLVAVGFTSGVVRIVDASDPDHLRVVFAERAHNGPVLHVKFQPHGGHVVTVGATDRRVMFIRMRDLRLIGYTTLVESPLACEWITIGDHVRLFIGNRFGDLLTLRAPDITYEPIEDFTLPHRILKPLRCELKHVVTAFANDCRPAGTSSFYILCGDSNNNSDNKKIKRMRMDAIDDFALHGEIIQCHVEEETPSLHLKNGTAIAVSPNGELLATASADGVITVRRTNDIANASNIARVMPHDFSSGGVTSLVFNNESNYLYSAGADGGVFTWDVSLMLSDVPMVGTSISSTPPPTDRKSPVPHKNASSSSSDGTKPTFVDPAAVYLSPPTLGDMPVSFIAIKASISSPLLIPYVILSVC
jgi:WD40 repeat protein